MFKINMLPKLKARSLRPPSGWLSQAPPMGWVNPRQQPSPTSRLFSAGFSLTATRSVHLLAQVGVIPDADRNLWMLWWESLPQAQAGKVEPLTEAQQPSNRVAWVTELVFLMQLQPVTPSLH